MLIPRPLLAFAEKAASHGTIGQSGSFRSFRIGVGLRRNGPDTFVSPTNLCSAASVTSVPLYFRIFHENGSGRTTPDVGF